ncbi:MAG: ABC transporter substrate-binding protein [Nitrospinota bacterium]
MRRKSVVGICLTLFLLCSATRALTADKASIASGWVLTGAEAPYFLAEERGYYKAEGIDLTISRGYGSGDTVRRVNLAEAMFGHADSSAALVGRARGAKVKILGVVMARSPHVIFSLKKTGIRTPADLKGKRIGAGKSDVVRIVFPAFAKINGLDPGTVNWVSTTPAVKGASLLAGKLDAITNFTTDRIPLEPKAKATGVEIVEMQLRDWGLDLYSYGIFTNDKLIAERRDLVARFVRASIKGFAAALEDPKGAVTALTRKIPALSPTLALKQLKIGNDLLLSEEAYKGGLGTVSRKKMSIMIDLLTQYMNLPRKISPDEIYTNEFLPGIIPKKGS